LRGQYGLQGSARTARPALLGPVTRRRAAGDRRIRGSSLVHRRAIPSRAEVAPVRAASVVCVVHSGGGEAEPAGVNLVGWAKRSVPTVSPRARGWMVGTSRAPLPTLRRPLTNAPIVATNRFRKNNNLGSTTNDHGNARLSLSAGPPAGADEALRYADAETVGQARHQAGRLLHHADRHLQSG